MFYKAAQLGQDLVFITDLARTLSFRRRTPSADAEPR
jgi:hypothetical protein